jgi:ribonuclease HI
MLQFGKYRNQALKEVIKKDKQYLEWLNTQPWFTIKFKDLHHQTIHLLNENLTPIKTNDAFVIYTDGACSHNGSKFAKAGIGVHFSPNNKIKLKDLSSRLHIDKPTNNKAELTAIKEALELCKKNNIKEEIIIFTDSDYSIKAITLWYPNWVESSDIEKKKNVDILSEIESLYNKLNVKFQHIKAHTGLQDEHSIGNANADRLAVESLK